MEIQIASDCSSTAKQVRYNQSLDAALRPQDIS
jgi:hypothetical protein